MTPEREAEIREIADILTEKGHKPPAVSELLAALDAERAKKAALAAERAALVGAVRRLLEAPAGGMQMVKAINELHDALPPEARP